MILCVGDSHTWGKGRGYPERLAELLAERSPQFRVVNLGVPGANTAQTRKRWIDYLDRYEPEPIVLWAGINNAWNRADSELWEKTGGGHSFTDLVVEWSRVARFFRVWSFQKDLRTTLQRESTYVTPDLNWERGSHSQTRTFIGRQDAYVPVRADALASDELTRVTEADVTWLIDQAARRGVPVVPIAYGLPGGAFLATSRGIRAAATSTGASLVGSYVAGERLREHFAGRENEMPALYTKSVHPTPARYDAIADLIFETIEDNGLPAGRPGFRE